MARDYAIQLRNQGPSLDASDFFSGGGKQEVEGNKERERDSAMARSATRSDSDNHLALQGISLATIAMIKWHRSFPSLCFCFSARRMQEIPASDTPASESSLSGF